MDFFQQTAAEVLAKQSKLAEWAKKEILVALEIILVRCYTPEAFEPGQGIIFLWFL